MLSPTPDLLTLDYLARKYDECTIPLYISYPTSSYWNTKAMVDDYRSDLSQTTAPFIYMHFPFCEQVCHYCMCYKVPNLSTEDRTHYLHNLTREIELKTSLFPQICHQTITHLHWGGGTPTCMKPAEMEMVYSALQRYFTLEPDKGSFSVEAFPSPSAVTPTTCATLSRLGFNEISFGVQDLDRRVQQAINRTTTFEQLATVVTNARKSALAVHLDLCYGLPFQELGGFEQTIRRILSLEPDRVALLTYIHFPLMFPNQRAIPMGSIPNSFMRVLLAQRAEELFTDAGYRKIGFDHFVKPDNPLCRAADNRTITRDLMGYSVADRKNVLGFGSSAISFLNNSYYHNAKTVDAYNALVAQNTVPLHPDQACCLTTDDRIRAEIIQHGILSRGTIDTQQIEQRFDICFATYFAEELTTLKKLEHDGLITMQTPSTPTLTATGRLFTRHIASVFDRYTSIKALL